MKVRCECPGKCEQRSVSREEKRTAGCCHYSTAFSPGILVGEGRKAGQIDGPSALLPVDARVGAGNISAIIGWRREERLQLQRCTYMVLHVSVHCTVDGRCTWTERRIKFRRSKKEAVRRGASTSTCRHGWSNMDGAGQAREVVGWKPS